MNKFKCRGVSNCADNLPPLVHKPIIKIIGIMYQYKNPKYIEIQCISTKCGLYKDLKIGKWYNAIDDEGAYYYIEDNPKTSTYGYGLPSINNYTNYDKSLFRTKDERRDSKLNKILNSL